MGKFRLPFVSGGANADADIPYADISLASIASSLQQLVALKCFELGFPLDNIRALDGTGEIGALIDAHSVEVIAKLETEKRAASGGVAGADARPAEVDFVEDILFYDRVRRLAFYLEPNLASGRANDMDDLEEFAKMRGWTRETIVETMRGVGLD